MATLYVALEDALLVVRGGDGDWTATRRLDGRAPECVAVSPAAPERVLCGTFESGPWRSTDGGDAWERVEADGMPGAVTSATVSPHDPDEVWVGTEPSRVFRSRDGGDTWAHRDGLSDLPSADEWHFPPRPETHHVRWLSVSPADPDRVYVGIEAGAFVYTPDGGETWHERPRGARRDNHSLSTHPDDPERVYAAAGDGYAESTDGGESWSHPQAGLDHRYCWSVAVDPADPDTRVLSAAAGAYAAHRPGTADAHLYRRTAGDDAWTRAEAGVPSGEGVTRAVLAAGDDGEFYAATNRGIARSTDAGRSWHDLPGDWTGDYATDTVRGLAVVP